MTLCALREIEVSTCLSIIPGNDAAEHENLVDVPELLLVRYRATLEELERLEWEVKNLPTVSSMTIDPEVCLVCGEESSHRLWKNILREEVIAAWCDEHYAPFHKANRKRRGAMLAKLGHKPDPKPVRRRGKPLTAWQHVMRPD